MGNTNSKNLSGFPKAKKHICWQSTMEGAKKQTNGLEFYCLQSDTTQQMAQKIAKQHSLDEGHSRRTTERSKTQVTAPKYA